MPGALRVAEVYLFFSICCFCFQLSLFLLHLEVELFTILYGMLGLYQVTRRARKSSYQDSQRKYREVSKS